MSIELLQSLVTPAMWARRHPGSTAGSQAMPDRVLHRRDERGVPFELLGRRRMRPRRARLDRHRDPLLAARFDDDRLGGEPEPDLPPAGELDIDLGEQSRVDQRAVLDPDRAIDAEARAQGIEAVLGAGEFLPREGERVDHPALAQRGAAAAAELVIDE